MNFDKIVGHTGHLVLSSDGVILSSGGDLGRELTVPVPKPQQQ